MPPLDAPPGSPDAGTGPATGPVDVPGRVPGPVPGPPDGMRIGQLSDRLGVSTHLLRVWESRYGLLSPSRSVGGYRLYGPADERRARAVLALRGRGVRTVDAAAQVLAQDRLGHRPAARPTVADGTDDAGGARPDSARLVIGLHNAVDHFDETAGHAVLDEAFEGLGFAGGLGAVVLPYLRELGARWADGTTSVAHEHFASQLIRRRVAGHALAWGVGTGPVAVLACPPGEQHDLALLSFGVLLHQAGWRVRYLGQDTPLADLAHACRAVEPDLVVLAATRSTAFSAHLAGLRRLAGREPLAVAGAGASARLAGEIGATLLPHDLLEAVSTAGDLVRRTS